MQAQTFIRACLWY